MGQVHHDERALSAAHELEHRGSRHGEEGVVSWNPRCVRAWGMTERKGVDIVVIVLNSAHLNCFVAVGHRGLVR